MENRRQVLVKALQDSNEEVRTVAAEALEKLEIRSRVGFLEKLITTGEKIEKLRAVYALSGLRGSQVTSLLLKAFDDPVEDVRAASIRVLGQFADKSVLPNIVEKLKDPSPVVERVVIDALSNFREPQLLGPLMQMLRSKDSGVIERALDVVSRTGDRRAEDAMLYFAVKGNLNMKCFAMKALGVME